MQVKLVPGASAARLTRRTHLAYTSTVRNILSKVDVLHPRSLIVDSVVFCVTQGCQTDEAGRTAGTENVVSPGFEANHAIFLTVYRSLSWDKLSAAGYDLVRISFIRSSFPSHAASFSFPSPEYTRTHISL